MYRNLKIFLKTSKKRFSLKREIHLDKIWWQAFDMALLPLEI